MRRTILSFTICMSSSLHAFNWQDLWQTKDQQARQMMQKNDYSSAEKLFTNIPWKAAAAYRAGDYESAAVIFSNLKTENGYYNQGNALAHMGKYEEAIEAYDKALAIKGDDQDTLFNRKKIEDLLKNDKNKEENKEQNKQDQDKQEQDKQKQNKQEQDKQEQDKQKQNKQEQNKQEQDKQEQNKQEQNKQDQDKQDQDKQDQDKQEQDKQEQDKQEQDKQEQDKQDQNNQENNNENQNMKDKKDATKKQSQQAISQSEQEKKRAKEQWLRLIPDDPGGLTREKFLRDHLRRQRGWGQ